ncbi:MAG: coproporphyrinogen III oxidase family protein [Candidatus Riflebacteria bacterium]|nr:coproporphyrinogen III oxidase family protein [Candidatus Riflebacteria bacterium]
MTTPNWIDNARKQVELFNVQELRAAGLIPKGSLYYPAIYYPPIPMFGSSDEASMLKDLNYDGSRHSSVYVHIPFCRSRCTYCHWTVNVGSTEQEMDDYLISMAREMVLWKEKVGIQKIYPSSMLLGGGTPTVLSAKQINNMFRSFEPSLDLTKCKQITCEMEPGSILGDAGIEKLRVLKDNGVTRVCLGVQAFDDQSLKEMGRVHSSKDAMNAIEQARKVGFKSVAIDLIYGYPGCTLEKWLSSLETALAVGVDAFQLYRLRIVPHGDKTGAIKKTFETHPESFPSVEELYVMKQLGALIAGKGGLNEVSRRLFTRGSGHASQYLKDHTDRLADVIGFGISSWSNVQGRFYLNTGESLVRYSEYVSSGTLPINRGKVRTMDDESRWAVTLSLKHNGLLKKRFRELTGLSVSEVFPRQIENLKKYNLISESEDMFSVTPRGVFFADEVVTQFYNPKYLPFPRSCYSEGDLNPFSYGNS